MNHKQQHAMSRQTIIWKLHLVLIFMLFLSQPLVSQVQDIAVDLSIKYQEIDNFGASDCWSMQKIGEWHIDQRERVADLLFSVDKGIGLSAWRFNIGAGINRATIQHPWRTVETFEISEGVYDWTRQKEERWFLQAAKARGVDRFIAFVNSPPARMTRNGYTNCTDGLGSTNLKDGYEGPFARYLVDILKHFRDEWGIHFDYISPVNEPQWEWNIGCNQEGNRASNGDIKRIVYALYDELQRQQVETKISIVESGDLRSWYQERTGMSAKYGSSYGNYLTEMIADEALASKIASHFSGHSYRSDRLENQLVTDRQNLFMKILPFLNNGWKYWMTEYCVLDGPLGQGGRGKDLTINTALDVARIIHYDLTALRASAWQWWTAVSPEDYKDGLIYTDYKDNPNSQSIIESKTLWALGNYSRFIRPGSVRIKLSGANDKYGLLGSAYLSPDRDKLVIVFVNMSNSAKQVAFNVIGLNSNQQIVSFTPYITSDQAGENLKQYGTHLTSEGYTVPARSVVTLIGEIIDSTGIDFSNQPPPDSFKLFENFPNPFSCKTNLYFYLPEPAKVKISIYSTRGEEIKTFTRDQPGGFSVVPWDGTNNDNKWVSSGLYFYSLQAGSIRETKKMIFIK